MDPDLFQMAHSTRRTGIIYDPRYTDHCAGPDHPECPERLTVIHSMLQAPDMQGHFETSMPRSAAREELLEVHTPEYIRRLEATAGETVTYLDPDTQASSLSHEAAMLAAGGICLAIEKVHTGKLDNAFAMVRPPGHHAERASTKGFCLYNNVAVGARFAQNRLGLSRILVVDWDLHFGNGTQHCFEEDPSLLFFSVHQAFTFPGGGGFRETGKGRGRGYSINIPLLPGCGDAEYVTVFEKILRPIALEFSPDLVLVSAGFDAHFDDPLGGMRVSPRGFAGLTRSILNIAADCCGGKLVMVLEGGYHLEALRDSVRAVLRELAGLETTDIAALMATAGYGKLNSILWRARRIHGERWQSIRPSAADNGPGIGERVMERLERLWAYFKS